MPSRHRGLGIAPASNHNTPALMNEQKPSPSPAPMDRRNFLKKSSTALAGGVALSALPVERFAHAAGIDTLKLALVGCGGRGSGAADQVLTVQPNVKLIAMA